MGEPFQNAELSADDLTSLHALGANVGLANLAVIRDGDLLNVGAIYAIGHTMGMADVTARVGTLATD